MREHFAFDAPNGVADAFGGQTVVWAQAYAARADVIYQSGGEGVAAAREAGRRVYKLKLRSSAAARAISTDYSARDTRRGTVYNITSVDPVADPAWVYLVVEA